MHAWNSTFPTVYSAWCSRTSLSTLINNLQCEIHVYNNPMIIGCKALLPAWQEKHSVSVTGVRGNSWIAAVFHFLRHYVAWIVSFYRRFGTICRSHFEGSNSLVVLGPCKWVRYGDRETSVANYQSKPLYIPGDGRLQLHCDANLNCGRFVAVYSENHTKPVRIPRGQKVDSVSVQWNQRDALFVQFIKN
jgi:hypothetical protein